MAFEVTGLYDFDLVRKFNYSEYLQLDAYAFKGAGNTAPSVQKLNTHKCSLEDYETRFYNTDEQRIINMFDGNLLCLDEPSLVTLRG